MVGLITNSSRPSKIDDDVNSVKYHTDFGRYAIGNGFNQTHDDWINQYYTNMLFFFGNQWINTEDLEAFLKDTSDQSRNRIKVKKNMILPTVAQYVGNAISMDLTIRCKAISPKAVNRRERRLEEQLFFAENAQIVADAVKAEFKKRYGIADNAEDTQRQFNNLWQDNYVKTMNMLMDYISEQNNFHEKKRQIAFNLALSGLAALEYSIHNGEMVWETVSPDRFFFDRTATEPNLSDAEYMGKLEYMLPSTLYEVSKEATNYRTLIESAVKAASNITDGTSSCYIVNGKVPVYTVYWIDSVKYKWGYVNDEFNYPHLVKIDYIEPGAKEPQYTTKDLLPADQLNETQKKIVGDKNLTTKWVDVCRFVKFIPSEVLATNVNKGGTSDIVIDYGIMPYQDTEYYKYANVKFPIKCYTWYYNNGFVFTPVSELINPQRMINRAESVKENIINNTQPSVLAYDKSMIDARDGEAKMLNNIYQGKPVAMNARGVGINNVITRTASTMDIGSIQAYGLIGEDMRLAMDRIIGVNDSMKGQSQGSEQLVGVTALQIQRASLIQEPFYDAIVQCFEQVYQSSANVGKRLYADNERELAVAVGDGNAQIIKLTKDYNLEDFRCVIHREASYEQQKQIANQMIQNFVQMGLIDKATAADLLERSTPSDVAEAVRRSAALEQEAAIIQARQQQQQIAQAGEQEAAMMAQGQMQMQQERLDGLAEKEKDREVKRQISKDANESKLVAKAMDISTQQEQQPQVVNLNR